MMLQLPDLPYMSVEVNLIRVERLLHTQWTRELNAGSLSSSFMTTGARELRSTSGQTPDKRSSSPVLSPNLSRFTPNLSIKRSDRFANGVPFGYLR